MRLAGCIWLWFGAMARLARLVHLVAFAVVAANADETTTTYRQERQSNYNPNIFGVASVAGVSSRNGRISSTGGVHFYPSPGEVSTSDYYNPLTFTKAINGKYASGSVQIHPGALGVSSSAQAGFDPGLNWPVEQWPRHPWPMQWPVQNQLYTIEEPWLNKVKLEPQSNLRRQWMYPSFNPFYNFWR